MSRISNSGAGARSLGLLLIAACTFAGAALCRQEPRQAIPRQPADTAGQIQTTSELVKIDASVLDGKGNFVAGLTQKNFRVLDDGVEQPVALFMPTEAPAQIALMLEASPSVYLIHDAHVLAAYTLLAGLNPDDEVSVVTYNQGPRIVLPFTTNKSAAIAAVGGINYALGSGQMNFYDSVSSVLDWIALRPGKVAIVLLTTGLDSSGPAHWSALSEKVRTKDAVIFTVALGGPLRDAGETPTTHNGKKKAKRDSSAQADADDGAPFSGAEVAQAFADADHALKWLATISGGRSYFPQSPDDFASFYKQIAAALRHEYVLGIAPKRDGEFHPITVQVLDDDGKPTRTGGTNPTYQILARQGYLAPHESSN